MPSVFLSSAAGDDDLYVAEFFADLRQEIASTTGQAVSEASFLGTTANTDRSWSPDMARHLAAADVFVALCSPRYLLNDVCGRQWSAFSRRAGHTDGARPATMIPVAWALDPQTPALVGEVVTPTPDGDPRGLRQLVRLRSLRASYQRFVRDLAERVVAAAAAQPLPPAEPELDVTAVRNAFALSAADAASRAHVHFVLAAGTRDEMEKVRVDLSTYGADAQAWTPYRPLTEEPLAERARSLAADQSLVSQVGSIDDALERMEHARSNNEIVVVLVDWWTTQLDAYQRVLAEIDRRGLGGTAVLVPASVSDPETMENRDELRFAVRNTFRLSLDRPGSLMRNEIPTPDAFDLDLAGVMEEARNRLYRVGPVPQPAPHDPPSDRPILRGP